MTCQRCKGNLGEEHYLQPMAKGAQRTVCFGCYDKLMAAPRYSTLQAVLRTFAFSALAAILCGLLAALPIALLTWNSAIVWVFLGAVMGRAVVRASEDRGNWYYRLIGLGSTWCAIGLSWLFCFAIWMTFGPPKDTDDKAPISQTALVSMLKPGHSSTPTVTTTPVASATPMVSPTPTPGKDEKPPNPAAMAAAVVFLSLLVILGAPVFVAIASPVSVLIYLFALHTTWKTSARESRQLEKVGPAMEPQAADWSRPDGES